VYDRVLRIYLDHHATTPVDPRVVAAMLPYFTERFGNPSSRGHAFGEEAARGVETARGQVAALVSARPEEIVFTSGATESNTLAVRAALKRAPRGGHLVASAIEHAAVLEPLRALATRGFSLTLVPPTPDGLVRPEAVADALKDDTVLVSLMAANNEVGTIQPVKEVGALCRERGILFHCDAVQAVGRVVLPYDDVDLLCLSAHKMYGPKGVGALRVAARHPRIRLEPLLRGGGQEKGLRSGTLNVPGIVGMGEACRLAGEALASGEAERIERLRDRLLAGLLSRLPGVALNGARTPRLPGNLHVSLEKVEGETLVLSVGASIAISSGAACAEAGGTGSHVLRAMGLPDERVYTALRFGVGRYNTDAEVDAVVEAVVLHASRLRTASAIA
jgi:cysteine desulfurase